MGLCKTSKFSIFTFINASNLIFCTCSYNSCVYHMMRFKGSNGKVCKMITSHFRTLLLVPVWDFPPVLPGIYIEILPHLWDTIQRRRITCEESRPSAVLLCCCCCCCCFQAILVTIGTRSLGQHYSTTESWPFQAILMKVSILWRGRVVFPLPNLLYISAIKRARSSNNQHVTIRMYS